MQSELIQLRKQLLQAVNKEAASAPKPQKGESEAQGDDIVSPFERTRAKRMETVAGEEEAVETPNEAALM